jgi:hypothetical protein
LFSRKPALQEVERGVVHAAKEERRRALERLRRKKAEASERQADADAHIANKRKQRIDSILSLKRNIEKCKREMESLSQKKRRASAAKLAAFEVEKKQILKDGGLPELVFRQRELRAEREATLSKKAKV